ncbi:MAG: protein phosphatase 2C domain-containing protein [Verrucomicrobia bacterium]|nr:protein phosphatase 2C domain-containing protein [Verrucomicrobiota bacterium]
MWRVMGACVAGSRHVRQKRRCEDTAAWFVSQDSLFFAVADGAGSAVFADMGSALAVGAALHAGALLCLAEGQIKAGAARRIVRTAVRCADRRIRRQARSLGMAAHDLATTLIVVIATPDFLVAAHVGDGAVVAGDGNGTLATVTAPAKGDFANETSLLGCNAAAEITVRTRGKAPFRSVAVFTDGLERLALTMPAGTPHPGFFNPLFNVLRSLPPWEGDEAIRQLLLSPRVAARSDDDRTLLVATLCD